ncbi:hypothetical protein [Streptomyces sp. NBC_01363]|uniref:hypothetical protein n=1 Tax=Streptomyces sp. NBC_01363 TaxID=2903840 RepID=UPI00225A9E55|nr:hypothetical protein [Streptomyces sp. NBC_01363]MCX4731609.1 hypothetical protein [Streptomyces sp. NBC_01363]
MTEITSKYADFEDLREQAIALRRECLGLRQIRDRMHIHNNDIPGRLVKGEPAPRSQGMTYDQIQAGFRLLIIYVTKSADLYHRVEGTWYGIVLGACPATG